MGDRKPPLEYYRRAQSKTDPVTTGIVAGCLIGIILMLVAGMILAPLQLLPPGSNEDIELERILVCFAATMWIGGAIGGFIGFKRRRRMG